jgi:hypothetical protein
MPRLTRKLPSYRLHRPSGLAVVTLDGKDIYLGPHGSPESRAEYERALAGWLASRRDPGPAGAPAPPAGDLTVNELVLAFWRHAERHYRTPAGRPSSELGNFRDSFRPLRKLYGGLVACEFSPL